MGCAPTSRFSRLSGPRLVPPCLLPTRTSASAATNSQRRPLLLCVALRPCPAGERPERGGSGLLCLTGGDQVVTACSHTSLGHSTAVPPCPRPSPRPCGTLCAARPSDPSPCRPHTWRAGFVPPQAWSGRTHDLWGERHLRCSAGHFPAVTTAHAHQKGPCPPGMDSTLETCILPQLMERRPGRGRAVLQEGGPLGTEASPQTTAVTRPQSAAGPGLEHEAPIGPHRLKASRRQQLHLSWEPKPASREPGEGRV